MDYSFTLTTDAHGTRLRNMFTRRSNTTLINASRTMASFRDFINHLDTSASIPKPIENMLIGTHANAQGYLFTNMYPGQPRTTDFEILEDTIGPANSARSISVPNSLIGFTAGNPINNSVHIKGCNLGRARPFLVKLKEAVGGNMNVTSPLHFHGIYGFSTLGVWELMAYEFRVLNRTAFASRADYINALVSKNFTFYNGDPVTRADWESWTPRRIDRPSSTSINWSLGTTIGRRTTIPFNREFRYNRRNYEFTITLTGVPGPTSTVDRMSALRTALDNYKYRPTDTIGAFDVAHPYPAYERWGYTSKQDFIDEHEWIFSRSGSRLICRGNYHDYTLIIPITDRAAANLNNLIFNFHPNPGSAIAAINTGLVESDANFFATV